MDVYAYFSHNFKKNLERWKLVKLMETKGQILWNIKIRWINMVAPSRVVLEEFKTLIVKMAQDYVFNEFVAVNYELLCDVETIMGFTCVIPMVELSKF